MICIKSCEPFRISRAKLQGIRPGFISDNALRSIVMHQEIIGRLVADHYVSRMVHASRVTARAFFATVRQTQICTPNNNRKPKREYHHMTHSHCGYINASHSVNPNSDLRAILSIKSSCLNSPPVLTETFAPTLHVPSIKNGACANADRPIGQNSVPCANYSFSRQVKPSLARWSRPFG